jgi:hypothetical protein
MGSFFAGAICLLAVFILWRMKKITDTHQQKKKKPFDSLLRECGHPKNKISKSSHENV